MQECNLPNCLICQVIVAVEAQCKHNQGSFISEDYGPCCVGCGRQVFA